MIVTNAGRRPTQWVFYGPNEGFLLFCFNLFCFNGQFLQPWELNNNSTNLSLSVSPHNLAPLAHRQLSEPENPRPAHSLRRLPLTGE